VKSKPIFHPYLIAIYPVLYLYSKNQAQVSLLDTILPAGVLLVSAFTLMFVLTRTTGSKHTSAVAVSASIIWLFSYSAARALMTVDILGLALYRHRTFILVWLVVFVSCAIALYRFRFSTERISRYLSVLAPVLILFPLSSIVGQIWSAKPRSLESSSKMESHSGIVPVKSDSLPDVYYIILDAYTGRKALSKYLDIDNSDFIGYLEQMGFFVADQSRPNYSWTGLSISSSLNMEYVPTQPNTEDSSKRAVLSSVSERDMILNNKVKNAFRQLGYTYVDLAIWKSNNDVDPKGYMYQFATSDFSLALLRMTFLNRPLVENYLLGRVKRDRVLKKFEALRNLPPADSPRFVYAHFMIPHHPYVFDENGDLPPFLQMAAELGSEKQLYKAQLLYANQQMKRTIDSIRARSKRRPIIILQGDHGAYRLGTSESENRNMRMSILSAYYVPDSCRALLYPSITPVNTFRLIFKSCFGQAYDLLPDLSYFSTFEDFHSLENVTGSLDQ